MHVLHSTHDLVPIVRARQSGGSLLEGLLAIVIFSVGLLSLLMLLSTSLVETGNARYRSEASSLAADLIGQMWAGDRSLAQLRARFGESTSDDYQNWLATVHARLPGTSGTTNLPEITISDDRRVKVRLYWQAPGDGKRHQLVILATITD
jgi:type IV pilus assembly protein PilV